MNDRLIVYHCVQKYYYRKKLNVSYPTYIVIIPNDDNSKCGIACCIADIAILNKPAA